MWVPVCTVGHSGHKKVAVPSKAVTRHIPVALLKLGNAGYTGVRPGGCLSVQLVTLDKVPVAVPSSKAVTRHTALLKLGNAGYTGARPGGCLYLVQLVTLDTKKVAVPSKARYRYSTHSTA